MTELASDAFAGTGADLGANWTPVHNTFKRVSDHAEPTSLLSDACEMYDGGITWPDDQYAQVTVSGTGSSGNNFVGIGVALRCSTAGGQNYYRVIADPGAAVDSVSVTKRVAGVSTDIGASINVSWANGDILKAEIVGFDITIYKNGSQIGVRTDAGSSLASGKAGVAYSSTITAAQLDDWSAGDMVAGAQNQLAWIRA